MNEREQFEAWAKKHGVQFVSRSSGEYTTGTVSLDALRELAALAASPVPAGHWIAPDEPTEEMLRAGWNAYLADMQGGFERFGATYRAMRGAAPTMLNGLTESAASVSAPAQQAGMQCERCGMPPVEHGAAHWCDNQSFQVAATAPSVEAQANRLHEVIRDALESEKGHGDFEPSTERLDAIAETVLDAIAFESGARTNTPNPSADLASFCDAVFKAAVNCEHTISDKRITLTFNKSEPGHNALNQLHRRLYEAICAALKENSNG